MASQPTIAHTTHSSGFFVTSSGLIVTNRHAIAGVSEISVTLHDTTKLNACVLATAAQSDIAVLKVDFASPVAAVKFGDSDRIRPGDPVFVIGNPLGHGNTVTAGIVSALDRNSAESQFGSFFQIDAALNQGNSGGPVFNADGEVVGVATALFSPGADGGSVGLGLAIPGNDARLIADRLLEHGQVQLGWIGAHIQPVTADLAAAVKLPAATGSIVTGVEDGSPAARAGVAAGDVILKVGEADEIDPRMLNQAIAASRDRQHDRAVDLARRQRADGSRGGRRVGGRQAGGKVGGVRTGARGPPGSRLAAGSDHRGCPRPAWPGCARWRRAG